MKQFISLNFYNKATDHKSENKAVDQVKVNCFNFHTVLDSIKFYLITKALHHNNLPNRSKIILNILTNQMKEGSSNN